MVQAVGAGAPAGPGGGFMVRAWARSERSAWTADDPIASLVLSAWESWRISTPWVSHQRGDHRSRRAGPRREGHLTLTGFWPGRGSGVEQP